MLHLFGLLLGVCACVAGLAIVVVTKRNQGVGRRDVGTCVVAAGLAGYGLIVMGLGAWLMLWAAGLA